MMSFFYAVVSICGYITFGSNTDSNIYSNDYQNSLLVVISKFALIFALVFAMPFNVMPIRDTVINYIHSDIHPNDAPKKTF